MTQAWIRNLSALALLAVASVASAGILSVVCGSVFLPGIDTCGCYDYGKGGCLKFVGLYNCKCNTLVVTGRGTVTNCSGQNQCYKNSGLGGIVLSGLGYCGSTCVEQYAVAKNGCAVFLGGYKCVTPSAPT